MLCTRSHMRWDKAGVSSISIQLVLVLQMGFSAFNYARADYQDLLQCHKDQTMEILCGRAPIHQGHLQR